MQIDRLYSGVAPARPNNAPASFSPAKPSAGSPPDTVSTGYLPADGLSQPTASKDYGSIVYGNVSLDLYASRSESLTRQIERQGPDGYRGLRQELSRRFEAGLSLDFSFLATVDGAVEKLSALDGSVMRDWMDTASDLLNLKEQDFKEFVKATDELFNEIEKVLGLGPDGLDNVADFFSGEVSRFLDDVKANMEYFDKNPLGASDSLGLDIPALGKTAKSNVPDDFKAYMEKFLDDLFAQLLGEDNGENTLLKTLDELFREIINKNTNNNNKELNSSASELLDNARNVNEPENSLPDSPLNLVA